MKKKDSDKYIIRQVHDLVGLGAAGIPITASRPGNTGRKTGNRFAKGLRLREVSLTMQVSDYYDPAHLLAVRLQDALDKANLICPVKQYPERVGELAPLKDPAAQLRSIAAIYVKKYRLVSPTIMAYYPAIRKRELLLHECREIIDAASRLVPDDKAQAQALWLKILESGGEKAHLKEQKDDEEGEPEEELSHDDL